jgi:uncharacterized protein with HEPN domain
MSDSPVRSWQFYIQDMIGFTEKVLLYTQDLDRLRFATTGLNYDATLRNLELIGEVATQVPEAVRAAHPEVPWRLVIATRNRQIHACLGLDNDTLWSIVQTDVPALLVALRSIPHQKN